jgi:hypothetical protein
MSAMPTIRRVADTVVMLLRDCDSKSVASRLSNISARDWRVSYHWLDASGVALYLLNAVKLQNLEDYFPLAVLDRLEENHRDNQSRLADQFQEFRRVNAALRRAGVLHVNLKGFTLASDYCPDLSLRYQFDLDIMIHRAHARACREALHELGYVITAENRDTLEFKAGEDRLPKISELYRARRQRALEVHFASPVAKLDLREDSLDRVISGTWNEFSFPRLEPADMFLAQVFHLFRHLLSEWVRLSWFYEFNYFLQSHSGDTALWREITDRATADENVACAIALVVSFSRKAFSRVIPANLGDIEANSLNVCARLWIDRYAHSVLLSDFPGTKLYLLLLRELATDQRIWKKFIRQRLLPFHLPPTTLLRKASASSLRRLAQNTRYSFWRGRFHVREGARYVAESRRWKICLKQAGLAA